MEAGFYGVASVGALMGEGVTGSMAAMVNAVLKTDSGGAAYTVANEYICGRLAMAVGLPVPPGTIAKLDDGSLAYVLLRFGLSGDKPPPAVPEDIVTYRAGLAAGVVLFDSWVLNGDRHDKNLAYLDDAGLSIFDHGHALFGTSADKGVEYLTANQDVPALGGCLAPHLKDASDLFRWSQRLSAIPDDLVVEVCNSPRYLKAITRDEAKAASAILNARKMRLWTYVEHNKGVFPGITDWGLSA